MSETQDRPTPSTHVPGQPQVSPVVDSRYVEPTGWTGMVVFAAMIMLLVAAFQAIAGLAALFNDDIFLIRSSGLVVNVDFTTWGWIHLGVALLLGVTAFGLLRGALWARIVGVGVACLSAVANMAFMQAYPFWSLTIITLDVLIIWAICVHGREMKQT